MTPRRGALDLSAAKEAISSAYVHAVASAARCLTARPEPDHDKVDLTLRHVLPDHERKRVCLDLQLKATSQDVDRGDHISFPLKQADYNALCGTDLYYPRLLVVVVVPDNSDRWTYCHERAMLLRHCGYWASLRTHTPTTQTSKVVSIPKTQRFDVDGLCRVVRLIRNGALP